MAPLKPKVDVYVQKLLNKGGRRFGGTMRLVDLITKQIYLVSSLHLKAGGGVETMKEYLTVFATYDQCMENRYGKEPGMCHIVLGDFNINPHHSTIPRGWVRSTFRFSFYVSFYFLKN